MNEVHSILQRMRDLAVQASNTGSQDTTAREAAQKEVSQLTLELDRIGDTTRFGNTKLLDGNFGANRSEEHTSELQSLMRISYAVIRLKEKNNNNPSHLI